AVRDGSDATAVALEVRVLAGDEVPVLESIAPAAGTTATLGLGEVLPITVTLDLPAPAGGVVVDVTVNGGVGSADATVTVPADERSATFQLTAADTEATGSVDVSLDAVTLTLNVEVLDGPPTPDFVETFDTASSLNATYKDGTFTG